MQINIPTFHRIIPQPGSLKQTLVPLPEAPINGSQVPWLTSIHATQNRGPYGDRKYRGNCGGYIIKDLLRYFQPANVLDPMRGSGTCADVCTELSIPCHSFDIRLGRDAADPASYQRLGSFGFVWMHPPYWKMIKYNDDARCLSNAPTLDDFLDKMRSVLSNCRDVLTKDGKIAVLIGGFSHKGKHIPLAPLTLQCAIDAGLWPTCTEIIRFQYGNTSSQRQYRSSFIPGLHDTCMVFAKEGEAKTILPTAGQA